MAKIAERATPGNVPGDSITRAQDAPTQPVPGTAGDEQFDDVAGGSKMRLYDLLITSVVKPKPIEGP